MTGFYDEIKASSGMYKFYSNGEWMESTSGKGVSILNPTSNESVYQVQGEQKCSLLPKIFDEFPRVSLAAFALQMTRRPSPTFPCRGKRWSIKVSKMHRSAHDRESGGVHAIFAHRPGMSYDYRLGCKDH